MMDKNGVICEYDGHVIDLSGKTMPQKTLEEIKAEQEALFQRLMGKYSTMQWVMLQAEHDYFL